MMTTVWFSLPLPECWVIFLTGLQAIQDTGCGLPSSPSFAIEYSLEKMYVEIGKSIGMDWVR